MNGKFVSKTNILAGAGIDCNIAHNICERGQSCGYGMAATGVEFNEAEGQSHDVGILAADIMHNLVISTLQEGGIDRIDRLHTSKARAAEC
ncbi:hypothetical protein [Paenibacillus sp. MMO-177]|uniref:hypothetical protein n=1 Tax=Paenibacillus sp. MMO-177 TaxID=3081289 RepID=UPI0030197ABD